VLAHTEGTPLCQQLIHNFWLYLQRRQRQLQITQVELPCTEIVNQVAGARLIALMRPFDLRRIIRRRTERIAVAREAGSV